MTFVGKMKILVNNFSHKISFGGGDLPPGLVANLRLRPCPEIDCVFRSEDSGWLDGCEEDCGQGDRRQRVREHTKGNVQSSNEFL